MKRNQDLGMPCTAPEEEVNTSKGWTGVLAIVMNVLACLAFLMVGILLGSITQSPTWMPPKLILETCGEVPSLELLQQEYVAFVYDEEGNQTVLCTSGEYMVTITEASKAEPVWEGEAPYRQQLAVDLPEGRLYTDSLRSGYFVTMNGRLFVVWTQGKPEEIRQTSNTLTVFDTQWIDNVAGEI